MDVSGAIGLCTRAILGISLAKHAPKPDIGDSSDAQQPPQANRIGEPNQGRTCRNHKSEHP